MHLQPAAILIMLYILMGILIIIVIFTAAVVIFILVAIQIPVMWCRRMEARNLNNRF